MRRVLFSAKSYTRTRFDLPNEEVVEFDALVGIVELLAFLVAGFRSSLAMVKERRMTLLSLRMRGVAIV